MSQFSFWGPGSKQELALVNLVPRSLTGTFLTPCRLKTLKNLPSLVTIGEQESNMTLSRPFSDVCGRAVHK
jgi:hypothetical protein